MGEQRISCGILMSVYLCHYEESSAADVNGKFTTMCVRAKMVPSHLMNHPKDYCGECEEESTTTRLVNAVCTLL